MTTEKPKWLKVRYKPDKNLSAVEDLLKELGLNTVCEEAACPNRMECFSKSTATFMILGRQCTRNCRFCNITNEKPEMINKNEPDNISKAALRLKLKHIVITSVTRDDLPDGGSKHFANVIKKLKLANPQIIIEVLIPDFKGDTKSLENVVKSKPNIINHNVETVPKLYPDVRTQSSYQRSLTLLKNVKDMTNDILTKSGIMLGLGEEKKEIEEVLQDLKHHQVDIITIGQYLAPSPEHYPMKEYIKPEVFEEFAGYAKKIGFKYVASAPLVRSSYNAAEILENK